MCFPISESIIFQSLLKEVHLFIKLLEAKLSRRKTLYKQRSDLGPTMTIGDLWIGKLSQFPSNKET